jgi:type II secretory pathway predicted ATPase ExeA
VDKKLLALYGLKWNPFSADVPTEALFLSPKVESFSWRVEQQVGREGGFASIVGDPGTGKSIALRLLADRLGGLRDVSVGVLSRPQSNMADFYRELGDLFAVPLNPHNRWAGTKALREKWLGQIEAALFRPVVLIDEAQEMKPAVLSELRLLSSVDLDRRSLLTVVIAGDTRLVEKLRMPELLPVQSRVRVRAQMETVSRDDLLACLRHVVDKAGNPQIMSTALMETLADHAMGNHRALMTMANELLAIGAEREVKQLDEKLYFDVFAPPTERAAVGTKTKLTQREKRR